MYEVRSPLGVGKPRAGEIEEVGRTTLLWEALNLESPKLGRSSLYILCYDRAHKRQEQLIEALIPHLHLQKWKVDMFFLFHIDSLFWKHLHGASEIIVSAHLIDPDL